MNAAAQPILPQAEPYSFSEDSDHVYMTSAGARPKLTMSDNESYWTPNSVCVLVNRATDPNGMGFEKHLFAYSVFYLFALFTALVADRWIAW